MADIRSNLTSINDNINVSGSAGDNTFITDFGGNDTYTILAGLAGNVTITDNDASTINMPTGLTIDAVSFAAAGVQFTVNGFTVTILGDPANFNFVFGGTPLDPTAGTPRTYDEMAASFGTTIPATGEAANAGTAGDVNDDGTVSGGSTSGTSEFSITATAAAVAEGNTGTATLDVTVTRTGDTAAAATVDVSTADGTATTADSDYTAVTAQTVSFVAGETTKTVTLSITGDTTVEVDETFTASLANATGGATISRTEGIATLTITNDDDAASTFTLTTSSKDVVAPQTTDDTIVGISSADSAVKTLHSTDTIDGGAGTDTLKVDLQSSFTGFSTADAMKNIESVELSNSSGFSRSFSLSNSKDVTAIKADAKSNNLTLNELSGKESVELTQEDGKTTLNYTASKVTGADDTQSLILNAVGSKTSTTTTRVDIDGDAAIEALSITANGNPTVSAAAKATATATASIDTSYVSLLDLGGVKTFNITGAGGLDIDKGLDVVTKVDASAATGDLTLNIDSTTVEELKSGAGNDTITLDGLSATGTITDAGGTDSLILADDVFSSTKASISGFENLTILLDDADDETADVSNLLDVTALTIKVDSGAAANMASLTLANSKLTDLNVILDLNKNATVDSNIKTISIDSSGTSILTLVDKDKDANTTNAKITDFGTFSFSKVESLTANIQAPVTDKTALSIVQAAVATNVVINTVAQGDGDKSNISSLTIDAAKAESITLNAEGGFLGETVAVNDTSEADGVILNTPAATELIVKANEVVYLENGGDVSKYQNISVTGDSTVDLNSDQGTSSAANLVSFTSAEQVDASALTGIFDFTGGSTSGVIVKGSSVNTNKIDVRSAAAGGSNVTTGLKDDEVLGSAGNDVITTDLGDDIVVTGGTGSGVGAGKDTISLGLGADKLYVVHADNALTNGGSFDGGLNDDILYIDNTAGAVDLTDTTITNFETLDLNTDMSSLTTAGVNTAEALGGDASSAGATVTLTSTQRAQFTVDGTGNNGIIGAVANNDSLVIEMDATTGTAKGSTNTADAFVFNSSSKIATITDYTSGAGAGGAAATTANLDAIDLSQLATGIQEYATGTSNIDISGDSGKVIVLEVVASAGGADTVAASATHFTTQIGSGADLPTGLSAYVIVNDDDSAAIYKYTSNGDKTVAESELTLVGTVDSALVHTTNIDIVAT